jgi:hypothetical protein
MLQSWTATAEVDVDQVDSISVDDNEVFVTWMLELTCLARRMAHLNTKTQVAKARQQKEIAFPFLKVG